MNTDGLKKLLEQVRAGDTPVDRALDTLKDLPYADLGYAMVDHHRALRSGHPETIFSPGKTVDQIVGIARRLLEKDANIMATRAERPVYEALKAVCDRVEYHEDAPHCGDEPQTGHAHANDDSGHVRRHVGYSGCRRGGRDGRDHGQPGWSGSPMWAWQASTACSPIVRRFRPPACLWWWPVWMGPCPAWRPA